LFVALAVIVIIGGLFLAYQQQNRSDQPEPLRYQQETTGNNSPAVQGVNGDVNITIDQSQKGGKQK
jgi:hypothetical protein